MNRARCYKPVLIGLALACLGMVFFAQRQLDGARVKLGLTRLPPLENAPPVLAFTTEALGGFRGLIANALWIRASELQDEGKYFEMVQLADWITKLMPHFKAVWVHQAWNLVYNISIKFNDPRERWRWVQRGIELLRDQGLLYNPQETELYRELAWFYQHKIGSFLDDAQMYFKRYWAEEMVKALGPTGRPDYDELMHPQTDAAKARVKLLEEKLKLHPRVMKEADDTYGPFDWRLPEAHAVYWAMLGLKKAKREDLIVLRRVIYQSMKESFERGRLIDMTYTPTVELGPNVEIVKNTNRAYEDMMSEDPQNREHMSIAHRNFLAQAVYTLYTNNRLAEAARWYNYLGEKYPDKPLLFNQPDSVPARLSLEQFVIARVTEDINETSQDRVTMIVEGMMGSSFYNLALGDEDQAAGYALLAQKIWSTYQKKVTAYAAQAVRVGLAPFEKIRSSALNRMLDPAQGLVPLLADQLRTRLRLPVGATNAPTVISPAATNAPAASAQSPP